MNGGGNKIKRSPASVILRWVIRIFLYAWVVTILFPLFWMLATSLKDSKVFMAGDVWGWPDRIFLVNYIKAWSEANVSKYMLNTLFVVVMSVAFFAIMVTTSSYILAKYQFRFIKFFKGFYFVAMMIPAVLLIYQLYFQLNGIVDGFTDNLVVLALVYAVEALPGGIFLLTGFIAGIDKSFMEAAKIDGAGEWIIFSKIILPFVLPIVSFLCLTRFMGDWNEYLTALTFLSSDTKLTLSVGIQRLITKFTYESNYGVIFSSLVISLMPILLLYVAFQKVIQNGTDMGDGVK